MVNVNGRVPIVQHPDLEAVTRQSGDWTVLVALSTGYQNGQTAANGVLHYLFISKDYMKTIHTFTNLFWCFHAMYSCSSAILSQFVIYFSVKRCSMPRIGICL